MDEKQEKQLLQAIAKSEDNITQSLRSEIQSLKPSEVDSGSEARLQENAAFKKKAMLYDNLEEVLKTPEGFVDAFAELAAKFGYQVLISQAAEAEVAEDAEQSEEEAAEAEVAEGEGEATEAAVGEQSEAETWAMGKRDEEGWRYLPHLDMSIREGEAEAVAKGV